MSMTKHRVRCLVMLMLMLLAIAAPQAYAAESVEPPRFALVLANASYTVSPLRNPLSDGELMAASLRRAGFTVAQAQNLDRSGFYDTVRRYVQGLPAGAVSVLYYAGHGMQIRGSNYLIPVDMVPTSEAGVSARAVALPAMLEKLQGSKATLNIVILDACRNNPFKPQPAVARRAYEGLGLARVASPRGMVVAYSTAPDQLADDGGRASNSFYTQALAGQIDKPGLTIEQILKNVGDSVRRKTLDDQQPWFETSLVDDFYFHPPPGVRLSLLPRPAPSQRPGGSGRGMSSEANWYTPMTAAEWSKLDRDIARRVEYLTQDELPELEKRARDGGLVAQTTLGLVYRDGVRSGQADGAAGDWRTRERQPAVVRGNASNLLALRWLRLAAEAGFPPAQVELGEMYYEGKYVDRDLDQALYWLDLAAVADYPRARIDKAQLAAEANPGDPEAIKELLRQMVPPSSSLSRSLGRPSGQP